jgi:hypothetical protein
MHAGLKSRQKSIVTKTVCSDYDSDAELIDLNVHSCAFDECTADHKRQATPLSNRELNESELERIELLPSSDSQYFQGLSLYGNEVIMQRPHNAELMF